MKFFVYVLKSEKDGTAYMVYTANLEKRLAEHNAEKTKSIKYKLPMRHVYHETFDNKTEATKREKELKKNSYAKKLLFKKIFE